MFSQLTSSPRVHLRFCPTNRLFSLAPSLSSDCLITNRRISFSPRIETERREADAKRRRQIDDEEKRRAKELEEQRRKEAAKRQREDREY